jgi:hypothetical protein
MISQMDILKIIPPKILERILIMLITYNGAGMLEW